MIRKITVLLICIFSAFTALRAQQIDSSLVAPEGYEYVDSLVYVPVPRYTDSLKGRSILEVMPQSVTVNQSRALSQAAERQITANFENTLETEGYRIRIFFDNRQDSREASAQAEKLSRKIFPGYMTYRTFIYPNFKVTIGDFRTKADAQIALKEVSRYFPSAFVVKERMKFPEISLDSPYTVDTVKVLVPVVVADPLSEDIK